MHDARRWSAALVVLLVVLAGGVVLSRRPPVPAQAAVPAAPAHPLTIQFFVTSRDTNSILRYDGGSGAFVDAFVPPGSGGINRTYGLRFAPDGSLLASSSVTHEIKRYDGTDRGVPQQLCYGGERGTGWPRRAALWAGRQPLCRQPG